MYQSILFHRRKQQYLVVEKSRGEILKYKTQNLEKIYVKGESLVRIYSDGRKTISKIKYLENETDFNSDPPAPEGYFMIREIENDSSGIFLVESIHNGQERLVWK